MGLDKMCWKDVENAIRKSFSQDVRCTIYLNNKAPMEINDLDINAKIKKLQKKDVEINEILNKM